MGRRNSRPRRRAPALALHAFPVTLVMALVCGCAEEGLGGGANAGGVPRQVELTYRGAPRSEAQARVVSELRVPPDVAPWVVEGGPYDQVPIPGVIDESVRGLLLRGKSTKVIIPGPFDPQSFNHVVLTLLSRMRGTMNVHLRRAGRPVVSVREILLEDQIPLQRIEIPLGENRLERKVYDDLVLHIRRSPIVLGVVELVDKPLDLWVPDPASGPTLASIGDDMRPAIALSAVGLLEGRLSARRGSVLGISYAPVEELWLPGQESTLMVTLGSSSGWSERFELPLERNPSVEPRWLYHRHPLSGSPGGELTVEFRLASLEGSAAFVWVGQVTVFEPFAAPPTVLLVTSDTHRADHVGLSNRGVAVRTPTLDTLARRGVFFEWCQTSSNITIPSHAALMTGRHPRDTGVTSTRKGLTDRALTLAKVFRENGYRTHAAVSAVHLGPRIGGLSQGFDRFSAPAAGQRLAENTVDVLANWAGDFEDQPLFVWLHVFDAHGPYRETEEGHGYLDQIQPLPGERMDAATRRRRAMYRGEVTYLDGHLGRLLEIPRFRGGVVAVTGDHGESLGQHGFFGHAELYTDTLHVPLIIAWPDAPAGTRVSAPVRQIDLGRTLLDLAGLGSSDFPGSDLTQHLRVPPEPGPIFALSSLGHSASITADSWHLILHLRKHGVGNTKPVRTVELHELELYHLSEDPGCDENLVESSPEVARRLQRILVAWLTGGQDLGWSREAVQDAQDLADLAALGYADEASPSEEEQRIDPDCDCEWCERYR